MTGSLNFLKNLRLRGWFGKVAPVDRPKRRLASGRVLRSAHLRTILPVVATRSGSQKPFHLLCGKLGLTSLTFKTNTPLKESECLEVEILLQGHGPVKLNAQVNWVLLAAEVTPQAPARTFSITPVVKPIPCYTGQLEIWATEGQQLVLRKFLEKQSDSNRETLAVPPTR
jgi:hypothetical protein